MNVRNATHHHAKAIVNIIMDTQGAHVSRRGTIPHVERMLNVARRRPKEYWMRVAVIDERIRGFLFAACVMRNGLWEDKLMWQVQHLMGKNVIRPLITDMRQRAGRLPVVMSVAWTDDPKAGSLHQALQRMGFDDYATLMVAEGVTS